MTIIELGEKLKELKIPQSIYSLYGGLPSEKHCISKRSILGTWEVYYSERGIKSNLKIFQNEDKACEYFYHWVSQTAHNMDLI